MTAYAQQIAAARKHMKHDPLCAAVGGYENGCTCGMQAAAEGLDAIIASAPTPELPDDERGRFEVWFQSDRESGRGDFQDFSIKQYTWEAWQAAKGDALNRSGQPETEAWLIEWHDAEGHKRRVSGHNSIADYRMLFPAATVTELVRRDALTQVRHDEALQMLADQAQELDMGYGSNACPTCGKSSALTQARELTDAEIDQIANDGHRNAAGGIYATSVHEFARALLSASKGGEIVSDKTMPKSGEQWRLRRDHTRVCRVTSVDIQSASKKIGYVFIHAPWFKHGSGGRSLDAFLKQYERSAP